MIAAFRNSVCSMQCTIYSVQFALWIVHTELCIKQCAVCIAQCAVCIVNCAFASCIKQCVVCSVQCSVCGVQCAVLTEILTSQYDKSPCFPSKSWGTISQITSWQMWEVIVLGDKKETTFINACEKYCEPAKCCHETQMSKSFCFKGILAQNICILKSSHIGHKNSLKIMDF